MNKVIITFKFIYLYLLYWFVGLTGEDFYFTKGNYFADLKMYKSAIKYYKKSLEESEIAFIYASIGWCYAEINEDSLAIKNYEKALEKIKLHYVTIPLAFLYMENGNRDKCEQIFKFVQETKSDLTDENKSYYNQLEEYFLKEVS